MKMMTLMLKRETMFLKLDLVMIIRINILNIKKASLIRGFFFTFL
jgi:hypothetical protein